jgi:microcin C transport system permease protein
MPAPPNDVIERPPSVAPGPAATRILGRRLRVSPINRRRWESFKSNRRGYWSLWIFLGLFAFSFVAELIANDKPIIVRYNGETLFPIVVDYPESRFGGFLAVTDYKDPVILDEINANGWMLWPPIRYSFSSINKDYPRIKGPDGRCLGFPAPPPWATSAELCDAPPEQLARFQAVGNRNWLGTDDQGRDVVARIIYGFRLSMTFALVVVVAASLMGIASGAVQGFFGGLLDLFFQRLIEIWSSIPSLYVIIIVAAIIPMNFWLLAFLMVLFSWTALVGVVRAEFLRARNFEYVRAARALGVSHLRIMFRHVLPNAMVATLTLLPFIVTGAIAGLATLDFLGFGMPASAPSLGELTLQAKRHLQAPWLGFSAFMTFAIMLSLLVFIFEGVRDAFDPRKTFR